MEKLSRDPALVPPGGGKELDVFGVRVRVLVADEQTNGAYASYEAIVPSGGGPPPHVHGLDDEGFYVLEGEFEILVGDRRTRVTEGAYVYFPRHTPHSFQNVGTTTGRLLGTATPAGHERFFEDVNQLAVEGTFTLETAIAVCRKHGIELLPPDVA